MYYTYFNWIYWRYLKLLLSLISRFLCVFTSFAGSGVDICTFSTLTLLFSVSEKIATPTTVVIMGKMKLK